MRVLGLCTSRICVLRYLKVPLIVLLVNSIHELTSRVMPSTPNSPQSPQPKTLNRILNPRGVNHRLSTTAFGCRCLAARRPGPATRRVQAQSANILPKSTYDPEPECLDITQVLWTVRRASRVASLWVRDSNLRLEIQSSRSAVWGLGLGLEGLGLQIKTR